MFRFKLFPAVFDEDDGAGSGTPAAEAPPAVAAPAPPAPAAPATPEPQPGPWASDLETFFEDPQVRAQADRFLREKIQPHVTQLEQQYAPAKQLYSDLLEDPNSTFVAVANELYGEEVAQAIAAQLAPPEDPEPVPAATEGLDPRVQALLDEHEAQKRQQHYEAEIQRLKQLDPELDPDEFAPFVITAEGNMDQALAGYQQWRDAVRQRYGQVTPPPAAPAVVGAEGVGSVPPPVQKQYTSFADALNDTMNELRSNREGPTVVGSV